MTPTTAPPQNGESVPPRWRWGRVMLLVLLVGIGALGWHIYTGQRAVRQLRAAGFVLDADQGRVWTTADDWRVLFNSKIWIWESQPSRWVLQGDKARGFRNLDVIASALRRVNPEWISIRDSSPFGNVDEGLTGLQNVDCLKGLTGLQKLSLLNCAALQNVDGLKGLTGLQQLNLGGSHRISASALRELRAALPETDITFPDGYKAPPQ